MLRAGGRRAAAAAAVGRAPPRRGPCSSITASCGCQRTYPLGARVRAIRPLSSSSSSSSSTKAAETAQQPPPPQPQPQPPPGATVVARQVRTDQRGYKATLYFYAKDGAAVAAASEAAAPPPVADGKGQGETGEGEGEVTQSLKGTRYGKVAPPKDAASLQVCAWARRTNRWEWVSQEVVKAECLNEQHPNSHPRRSRRTACARCCPGATRAPCRRDTPST